MKLLKITCNKEEKTLTSYLQRNCNAWTKGSTIYVLPENVINYFQTLGRFKNFCISTALEKLTIKSQTINEGKLSMIQFAEIIFGSEAK
jgi:hypothetical protein